MIVKKFTEEEGGLEAWLNERNGKITGAKVHKVGVKARGGGFKKGHYSLVAEQWGGSAAINDEESAMDRGRRLEAPALLRFAEKSGKKIDGSLQIWLREDDNRIGFSPDGVVVGRFKVPTEAVEIKCLNGASHMESLLEQRIPENQLGYEEQMIQAFVVNDKLKTLYYGMYNPIFPRGLDFFYLTFHRKDLKEEIAKSLEMQRAELKSVREAANSLTKYLEVVPFPQVVEVNDEQIDAAVSYVASESFTLNNIKKHIPTEAAPTLVLSEEQMQLIKENAKSGLDRVYQTVMSHRYE